MKRINYWILALLVLCTLILTACAGSISTTTTRKSYPATVDWLQVVDPGKKWELSYGRGYIAGTLTVDLNLTSHIYFIPDDDETDNALVVKGENIALYYADSSEPLMIVTKEDIFVTIRPVIVKNLPGPSILKVSDRRPTQGDQIRVRWEKVSRRN